MLYLHIPFCKQACSYCDFHFSTSLSLEQQVVEAMCKEIELQKDYLSNKTLQSIYFGGGTPSIIEIKSLEKIFNTIAKHFVIDHAAEITLEANPDDLSPQKLTAFKSLGINRLSIGIQSFYEPHLQLMNRTHNSQEAFNCVQLARKAGFENFSIDLIYGVPHPDHCVWKEDIDKAMLLDVPHISTYALTVEPKTALYHHQKANKFIPATDDFSAQQYEILMEILATKGFQHYEISNFAKPPHYAKHNGNYWKKGEYLGIGASAHSYNGISRRYNIANNSLYIKALAANKISYQEEFLTPQNHINEYILVNLRTMWGCDSLFLAQNYGYYFDEKLLQIYQQQGLIIVDSHIIYLTNQGKLLADKISCDFFVAAD
jgi:oxygen-independent coproporphyrinogen-3 oxidase